MQVLLWSDRRSCGSVSTKRVEDLSWYACQILSLLDMLGEEGLLGSMLEDEDTSTTTTTTTNSNIHSGGGGADDDVHLALVHKLESEEWLPTPVLWVSAMRVAM